MLPKRPGPTKLPRAAGMLSHGMKSHGSKANKAAGSKSMKASPSLGGVAAFRPDADTSNEPTPKAQQFVARPGEDK